MPFMGGYEIAAKVAARDKYNKPNTVCKHDIDKIYMQLLPLDNLDMCDEVYDHYYDQANGSEGVGAEDPETP